MITIEDIRAFGRFGDHVTDAVLQRCLDAAQIEAAKYSSRVGPDLFDHLVLMWACHIVSLTERQPVGVRQDALMVSYESLGGDGGLCETTYGREVGRLINLRRPKVLSM